MTETEEAESVVLGLSGIDVTCHCGIEHRVFELARWFICVCGRHWHREWISGLSVWYEGDDGWK